MKEKKEEILFPKDYGVNRAEHGQLSEECLVLFSSQECSEQGFSVYTLGYK